jgi:hypothetical protein
VWIWALSIHAGVSYQTPSDGWSWGIELFDGQLHLNRLSNFYGGLKPFLGWRVVRLGQRLVPPPESYGFALPFVIFHNPRNPGRVFIATPLWLPMCPLGVLLAWTYRQERRLRDLTACKTCGYCLTGNLSGICPECGKPTADLPPGPA